VKRLIKKAEGYEFERNIEKTPEEGIDKNPEDNIEEVKNNEVDMSGLVELDQLSEADVRHERCPQCQYNPLKREDGFKVCPRCESVYKILDGKGYMVAK
jgi:Zn finger protein HypA/HybF involved in hydrogenase expression